MYTVLKNECTSISQFFDRFGVTEEERKTYIPLILSIEYSNGGELAPSYGIFLNSRNKCLYEVHGSECSVWDFDGQFIPELMIYENFEKILNEQDSSEKELLLKSLMGIEVNKDNISQLSRSYYGFIESFDITDKLSSVINKEKFETIFEENKIVVEKGLSYYQFETNYGYPQTFYVDFNMGKIRLSTNVEIKNDSFSPQFISDLVGSLEIAENIFSDNKVKKHKM